MAERIGTHKPGIQQDNWVAKIFSFLDPQQNKQRLAELGAPGYVQTEAPQPPQMAPDGGMMARQPVPAGGDMQPSNTAPGGFNPGTPVAPQPPANPGRNGPGAASGNRRIETGGLYDPRVAQQIIDGFVAQGYDPRFAAAMAANAMIESAGNPTAYNDSEGAFGLFQHRLDRLDNMRAFADRVGKDINDISTQVSFAVHEFGAGERMAYDRIMGGNPESAADYARLIDQYWERSDGSARNKRARLANEIYKDFYGEGGAYSDGQEVLSFGTDIDPYGVEDNVALMRDFDPSMMSMGGYEPEFNPFTEYFIGQPVEPEQTEPVTQSSLGGGLPLSMGDPASPTAQVPASQPTNPQQQPGPVPEDEDAMQGPIQSFLDRIYNTSDLSDEERRSRRKAMAEAFVEGLGYLTQGQANLSGVFDRRGQRDEAMAQRQMEETRAAGVAQMAEQMGLGQIAGLAYMGDAARNSLTNAMVSSMSSRGKGEQYDLDPESRETIAARMDALDRPDLARVVRAGTGKALEDAVTASLKLEPPTGGDTGVLPSAAGFAQYAREQGAPEPLINALENATTAAEVNAALDQLAEGGDVDPALVREYQYMQTLDPEQQRKFQEFKRAGAGGEAPEDLAREAVMAPIRADIERFSEQSTDLRNLAESARQQQTFLANPANTPNSLQAAAEPAVRLLQPILPDGFFEGAFNDQELLANRVIEGTRNSNLGNLASGVPGQLSNLEGDRLLSIMAGAGDRRVEGLALTQFIQRNAERQQIMNDARARYLANPGPDGYTTQGYERALAEAAMSVPVFREVTMEDYIAEAAQYDNDTMPLSRKSEIIMVRMPDGTMEFRTFGIYPEDE